jgi:hypothetical protein
MAVKAAKKSPDPKRKKTLYPTGKMPSYPKAPKAKAAPKAAKAVKATKALKASKASEANQLSVRVKPARSLKPPYNEETMKVLRDADAGKNLVRYKDLDDLFEDLGI